jgi:HK97 family phage major capsid protein
MLEEKLKLLKKTITEKRNLYNAGIEEALKLVERGALDEANQIKEAIEAYKTEISNLQVEVEHLEGVLALTPYEDEEDEERGRTNKMNEKLANFEKYIRSQGTEKRDLDSSTAGVIIPQEVSKEIFEPKRQELDLSTYTFTQTVGSASGKFPVAKNNANVLTTKAELALIADVEGDLFTEVSYQVETRAGKIALSNELIEDAEVNVIEVIKRQLIKMVRNTNNAQIIAKLKTFTKVPAVNLDEVKKVFNVDIDPSLDKKVVLNQDTFNYFDTLKDVDGKYLLQSDITSKTGKTLFGAEVIVVPNTLLATAGTELAPVYQFFVGDLESAVAVFNRKQVEAVWEKFDNYSKGLSVVVRNDFKVVDADAGRLVEFTPAVV